MLVITDSPVRKDNSPTSDIIISVKMPCQGTSPKAKIILSYVDRAKIPPSPHQQLVRDMISGKIKAGDVNDFCGHYMINEYEVQGRGFTHKFVLEGPARIIPCTPSFENLPVARAFGQTVTETPDDGSAPTLVRTIQQREASYARDWERPENPRFTYDEEFELYDTPLLGRHELVRMTLTTSIISAEERPMPEEGPRAALATFLSSMSPAQGVAPSQTRAYDTLPVVPSSVASAVSIKSSSSTAGAPLYAFGQSSRAGASPTHSQAGASSSSLSQAGASSSTPSQLSLHKRSSSAISSSVPAQEEAGSSSSQPSPAKRGRGRPRGSGAGANRGQNMI
ncbi:hypothetical protein EMPS_11633 [Entomortierella parvispora]|uniref:Uncharacterized protein n=1 Tax=Entomortierella parvispora TaxID=205924 RepID=A0A9P3HMD0_9FUNG|nr:hypothetical protein EMPS_11633 [Entomortierella parvispora]